MQQLMALVEHGIALASSGDRTDLRRRLELARERLQAPDIRVIVVGEFKQGKSQLVGQPGEWKETRLLAGLDGDLYTINSAGSLFLIHSK